MMTNWRVITQEWYKVPALDFAAKLPIRAQNGAHKAIIKSTINQSKSNQQNTRGAKRNGPASERSKRQDGTSDLNRLTMR